MTPSPAFRVRPAEASDIERWADLRAALWPGEPHAELVAEACAFFRGELPLLEAVLMAVDGREEIVGFAEVSRRAYAEGCGTSPVGFLEGWFVVPAWRRRGVARALMDAAERWARAIGCREFASDTALENAEGAAAHLALGFEEVERLRCFRKSLD